MSSPQTYYLLLDFRDILKAVFYPRRKILCKGIVRNGNTVLWGCSLTCESVLAIFTRLQGVILKMMRCLNLKLADI